VGDSFLDWQLACNLDSLAGGGTLDGEVAICTPYFTRPGWDWFQKRYSLQQSSEGSGQSQPLRILTSLSARNSANGSLDLRLLEDLLERGALIRHLEGIHAKIFLVGSRVIFGSSNLTAGGLRRNHEVVYEAAIPSQVAATQKLFEQYWDKAACVSEEGIRKCRDEAALLVKDFRDDDHLVARWNSRYVLLNLYVEVLARLRGIKMPAEVLGYSGADTSLVKGSTKIILNSVGREVAESVKDGCLDLKKSMDGLLQECPSRNGYRVVPLDLWEGIQLQRRKWEDGLLESLAKELVREYKGLRIAAYLQALSALEGFHKNDGPALEGLQAGLKTWFDHEFPTQEELSRDVKVKTSIKGLHPLEFYEDADFRREVLDEALRPLQDSLF